MTKPADPRATPVARYLVREGYRIELAPIAGGQRCTLRFGAERWEARGPDAGIAFDRAVALLAPSRVARELLRLASTGAQIEPPSEA